MLWAVNLGLFFSLLIHVIDQSTDVFAAVLFYFEGHIYTSFITLALVFLPGFCISITELRKTFCTDSCSFIKAIGYLLLSPLWAIIIHIYSFFDERYVQTAIFFKTIEGFVEAGPQLALQLSLLLKGSWAESSFLVIGPVLSEYLPEQNETETEITTTMLPMTTILPTEELNQDVHNGSLVIFDRVYDADARYYFGCLHIASVIVSFISIWSSSIIFNDVENSERQTTYDITTMSFEEGKSCCSKKNVGKIIFGAPFFLFTLIFRAIGLALLICFLQLWSGVIIFGLFFVNVLAALFIGDDINRSFTYALWSLFVPVGYSRDPSTYLGYTKVPLAESLEPPTEQDEEKSNDRTKHFLTIHLLSSIFILGTSLLVMTILVFTKPDLMADRVAFPSMWLTYLFLPILVLSLGISVLLVRPYHRCDCSGEKIPSGNIIV